MKKKFFILAFIAALLFATNFVFSYPPGACATGEGNQQCNGICVPVYSENGTIDHYFCAKPDNGSTATKDCYESYIGGGGVGDE